MDELPAKPHSLPTELIENIATYLDDKSLIAFSTTCRRARLDTVDIFGARLLVSLKFCMYPKSVQALADIANSHYAKHIKNVAFGIEDFGLINPAHDWDCIHGNKEHANDKTGRTTYHHVRGLRQQIDSKTIADALAKLPNLRLVMVGRDTYIDGEPMPLIGVKGAKHWYCLGDQCWPVGKSRGKDENPPVYSMIAEVLRKKEHRPPSFEVLLTVDMREAFHADNYPRRPYKWRGSDSQIYKHLQIKLDAEKFSSSDLSGISNLSGSLESLEVWYTGSNYYGFQDFAEPIFIRDLHLPHLQHLEMHGLVSVPSEFVSLLREYRDHLTHVGLVRCSLRTQLRFSPIYDMDLAGSWKPVIQELATMPQVKSLKLEMLAGKHSGISYDHDRDQVVDVDMATRAQWLTRRRSTMVCVSSCRLRKPSS
jgi:hypothetical protein